MKINVAVLFGGRSVEHEISVISAIQAMENMDTDAYEIYPIYITKDNAFYTGSVLRDIQQYRNIPALLKKATKVVLVSDGTQTKIERFPAKKFGNNTIAAIDVAFPIVHGTNVEDGSLQGYLKMLNLPFVGCDVLSSAIGMDKYAMKQILMQEGFPVLPAILIHSSEYAKIDDVIQRAETEISYPIIVKPVNLGSSVGISKAADREELINALDTAFSFADTVLLERAIEQLKEINCSVLGDEDSADASVLEEPFAQDKILSYRDKYIDGNNAKGGSKTGSDPTVSSGMASLKRKIPAEIPAEQENEIKDLAVRAFHALSCSGIVRIDFMIDGAENKVYINEINTIPGSLSFYLWEPAGLPYKELLNRLISIALKRARKQASITYSFDTNVFALGSGFGGSKGTKK